MGQYVRAIANYDTAIGFNPDDPLVYSNRGSIYAEKGQYHRAIADYDNAIRLKPDYANAYNALAWLLATAPMTTARNGARAVELALRAVSLDNAAGIRDTLAAAYAEEGRFADAVREQGRAIEMARQEKINDLTDWQDRLHLYERGQPYRE